jgi:hypothetical protein
MREPLSILTALISLPLVALAPLPAAAEDAIGQIKSSSGAVSLVRAGESRNVAAGERVYQSDVVETGPDGSVGITFSDNSMMSLGPGSRLVLERFRFDSTTHEGVFESRLERGTLAVKSGQLAKQSPEAMKVRTPGALLGVRGTEFAVRAAGGGR